MRILGYAKHWPKLDKSVHTTFRFPRKDSDKGYDWAVGETVTEVVKPRASHVSGQREIIGPAIIISKESRNLLEITHEEAIEDGFVSLTAMFGWLAGANRTLAIRPINKLTLKRI